MLTDKDWDLAKVVMERYFNRGCTILTASLNTPDEELARKTEKWLRLFFGTKECNPCLNCELKNTCKIGLKLRTQTNAEYAKEHGITKRQASKLLKEKK